MRPEEFGLVSASLVVSGRDVFNFDSPNGREAGVVHIGCLMQDPLKAPIGLGQRLFQDPLTYYQS